MSARDWQPGDRAYIEVEVEDVTRMSGVDTAFVSVQSTRPGLGRSVGVRVPAANLLASPDAIRQAKAEALRKALTSAREDVLHQVRRFEIGCEADAGYYDAHMEIAKHLEGLADRIGGE